MKLTHARINSENNAIVTESHLNREIFFSAIISFEAKSGFALLTLRIFGWVASHL